MLGLKKGLLVALIAAAVAPVMWAQTNMVGQDAPAFDAGEFVGEAPAATTMDQCRGDVVFIYYWGTR
jgi:hypothetical protein